MPNRTTKVSLVAEVNGYLNGMDAAAKKTRELGSEAEKLGQKKQAIADLGQGFVAVGTVAAVSAALAVARFAEFDAALSNVQAATQATTGDMSLLREAALDAGGSTVFTAVEAANAIEELGKAGLTTAQILEGGLNGALSLAAAGQLGVAEAAQITAVSLKQFKLGGDQASHVADLLAAGAGKAVGDVTDLSAALAQSGLVAAGTGLSIEETTGTLAAFADAGLLGSDAGTSFKTALQRLQPQTAEAAAEMKRLGINAYDANGQFVGVAAVAGQLNAALYGVSDAQRSASTSIIFGSDAVRAANVLIDEGAAGIQRYIDQTNDSGFAAQVAADRLDNLRGDVEKLGGALDTALIQTGSGANDSLRALTQGATALVDGIGNLPAPVLNLALALGVSTAALGLVGGTALLGVPKLAAFKVSLDTVGLSGRTAALGIGAATLSLTAITVALGVVANAQAAAATRSKSLADSFDKTTGAATDYTRELVATELAERGAFDGAKRAGISQDELVDAIVERGDKLEAVNKRLRDSGTFFDIGKGESLNAIREISTGLDDAGLIFDDLAASGDEVTDSTARMSTELDSLSGAAQSSSSEIDALITSIEGFGSSQLSVNAATREFEAAVDGVSDSLAKNAATLDTGTEAGRENQAALDDIASSALGLASATLTQTGSQDEAAAAIARGREQLILSLGQFGITGTAAETYADSLGLIPSNVQTAVELTGVKTAQDSIDQFIRTNNGRTLELKAGVTYSAAALGVNVASRAAGGAITGPGSGTSDSIPARLSNGEHVLTAFEVQRMGGQDAVYDFRRSLRAPVYLPPAPHYANGGAVTGGGTTVNVTNNVPAMVNPDPQVTATILGREFSRSLAGRI